MPTRNLVLTERQAEFVERLVASGRYQNASEVLRDGLRLVEHRDAEDRARIKALREAARVGIADVDGGRYVSFDNAESLRGHLNGIVDQAIGEAETPAATK